MDGVKDVAGISESPALPALLPVVQQDGDHGQNGESLGGDEEPSHLEAQSAHHFEVDVDHGQQLDEPAEFHVSEQIEHQHHENAVTVIVHEGEHTHEVPHHAAEQCGARAQKTVFFPQIVKIIWKM